MNTRFTPFCFQQCFQLLYTKQNQVASLAEPMSSYIVHAILSRVVACINLEEDFMELSFTCDVFFKLRV